MRKLATIALLALSLLTVACTESEDADFEAASIDDVDGLAIDDETGTLSERAPSDSEPVADRVGANGLGTAPGQPGTGTAECLTAVKLSNGEPVVGIASDELGIRARERFDQMVKIRGLR